MWQVLLVFGETIALFLSFYLIPEEYRKRSRNDHVVIIFRTVILAVFTFCVNVLHKALFGFNVISEAEIWGLRNRFIVLPIIVAAVHVTILFSGTIVKAVLWGKRVNLPFVQSLLCWSSYSSDVWVDLRNLFICPLLEELLYRGNILTFLLHSDYSLWESILISSVAFGSCHLHFIYTFLKEGYSVASAVSQCSFMFIYTTLFGILVSVVYVRTGSLVAASVVHALCNFFSLPSADYLREQSPLYEKRHYITTGYLVGITLYCSLFTTLLNPAWFHSQFYSIMEFVICSSKSIEITKTPLGGLPQYWSPAEMVIVWGKRHSFGTLSTIQNYLHRSM